MKGVNTNKINPMNTNVSPLKNQIMYNIKTKFDKKTALNTSDIPMTKQAVANAPNEKTNSSKNKNYSKSIDTKENQVTMTNTTNIFPTKAAKSPLQMNNYKIIK